MLVKKCKWKYGKQAPVMFMIDDFANKYMRDKKNGHYLGSDWGGRIEEKDSMQWFIKEKILKSYPYLRITYFLVVGKRADIIENGKANYSASIDDNIEFAEFLKSISNDNRFEIAYHGLEHGVVKNKVFVQEWEQFSSVNEAVEKINLGKDIYKTVTGQTFNGGKYCGYKSNQYSDESISVSGFNWWCRFWDGEKLETKEYQSISFDIKEFGNHVIDIPSTIDGSFVSLTRFNTLFSRNFRKYIRSIVKFVKYGITIEKLLCYLMERGYVINIQEHSSPAREDNKRQSPNIVDDIDNIRYILNYLSKYNLWYATGSEIADYYKTYSNVDVCVEENQIVLKCPKELEGNVLSIILLDHKGDNVLIDVETKQLYKGSRTTNGICFDLDVYNNKRLVIAK